MPDIRYQRTGYKSFCARTNHRNYPVLWHIFTGCLFIFQTTYDEKRNGVVTSSQPTAVILPDFLIQPLLSLTPQSVFVVPAFLLPAMESFPGN